MLQQEKREPLVQIVSYHGSESGVWVRESKVKK